MYALASTDTPQNSLQHRTTARQHTLTSESPQSQDLLPLDQHPPVLQYTYNHNTRPLPLPLPRINTTDNTPTPHHRNTPRRHRSHYCITQVLDPRKTAISPNYTLERTHTPTTHHSQHKHTTPHHYTNNLIQQHALAYSCHTRLPRKFPEPSRSHNIEQFEHLGLSRNCL